MLHAPSFFELMKAEKFTSITLQYDRSEKDLKVTVAKEWSNKVKWAGKQTEGMLKKPKKISEQDFKALIAEQQLDDVWGEILHIVRERRHEKVELLYDEINDVRCVVASHHRKNNRVVGGLRRAAKEVGEEKVISDTLNIAHEMTFRCAAGGMECGGGAISVHSPVPTAENLDSFMGFIGYVLERADFYVAPETGFSLEQIKKLQSLTSRCVLGEDPDKIIQSTVHGIYVSMEEVLKFSYGEANFSTKTIGIQGLGNIGSALAHLLLTQGADILIADVDGRRIEEFLATTSEYSKQITVIESSQISMQMGHVFAPCSHSGALTRDSIRYVDYHMVVGGANHLLDANTIREEINIAKRLQQKEILFVPGWISNIGAARYGVSLVLQENLADVNSEVEKICRKLLKEILQESQEKRVSPLEVAYAKFEPMVYS